MRNIVIVSLQKLNNFYLNGNKERMGKIEGGEERFKNMTPPFLIKKN
jgi:hypothetical protein